MQASTAALADDPVKVAADINKINKLFLAFEEVQLAEALDLVKKPRQGEGVYLFKRPRFSTGDDQQKSKRARTETSAAGT